ncbi:MAG: CYTH domain-containing protein [Candidatus Micrarchaeota archaeon]
MDIEFEATFTNIDKEEMRKKLTNAKATLVKPEFLQKRSGFHLPKHNEIKDGWLRVRDEGNKITMSLKIVDGDKITDQKEICLTIDNMKNAELLLQMIGCEKKAFQESKRELWKFKDTEVTIDEWPFLEPFLEVEGKSEKSVKDACAALGLDYSKALFCAVDELYARKYNISKNTINNDTPEIKFNGRNPFVNIS